MDRSTYLNTKRCTKCILPDTFPGISLDEQGVCNYCSSHERVKVLGEEALLKKLELYRNNKVQYNCIVPFSGGRDSTFVLHQMVKKYNMKVLGLTVDSGAITDEGYRNIKQAIKILNIEHVWLKNEKQIKIANNNTILKFNAWLKKPSINTIVPTLNAGDKTLNYRIHNYAHKNKIPLVLGGNNVGNSVFEQEFFKTGFMGIFPDYRGYYTTYDKIRLSLNFAYEYFRNYHNYRWSIFREYLEGMLVYFFEMILLPKDIESLGFWDYIYWNEQEILTTITEELDWQGAPDTTWTWRIDDSAYPLIDYIYYNLVGFTEFDEHYSRLIRDNQLSRKEALKRIDTDNSPRMDYLIKYCDGLNTNIESINDVLIQYREKLVNNLL